MSKPGTITPPSTQSEVSNSATCFEHCTCQLIVWEDLAFGESFGCLESSELHPWIRTIFNGTRAIPYVQALVYYRLIGLAPYLLPPSLARARVDGEAMSQAKLARRVEKGPNTERGDFLSYMLKVEGDDRMTKGELQIMAQILIVGGSETTATLLTGVTYHLLSNMSTYNKLVRAIRETFKSEGDIDMVSSAQVPYLSLVLDEGLRLFPPVAVSLPRIVPDQGAMVAGVEIPGKVRLPQSPSEKALTHFTDRSGSSSMVCQPLACQLYRAQRVHS